jgi:Nuclear transport factor 2 (NTF2) domain
MTEFAAADAFIKKYYRDFETARHKINALYLPEANMLWNGNPIGTSIEIQKFLGTLPPASYTVQSYDCQTLGNGQLLVTATGSVKYYDLASDPDPKKFFSEAFTLVPAGDTFLCSVDQFRFV